MKSSTLTPEALRNREISDRIHQQKLACIQKSINLSRSSDSTKYSVLLQRGYANLERERNTFIRKENKRMLDKINCLLTNKKQSHSYRSMGPKSLNFLVRKKEAYKIQLENSAIAKKLQEKNSFYYSKKFKEDYTKATSYKKMISKVNLLEKLRNINNKSPLIGNTSVLSNNSLKSVNFYDKNIIK